MSGKINGENVMTVSKISRPKSIQLFEKLLWVNTPKNWVVTSTYFHSTLFVVILVETNNDDPCQKIRRDFSLDTIKLRIKDIHGLASDCVDEMKTELKK